MDQEPEKGDYAITVSGPLGSQSSLREIGGQLLGRFATDDAAIKFSLDRMERENFWPNIWIVSDHGNWHLLER